MKFELLCLNITPLNVALMRGNIKIFHLLYEYPEIDINVASIQIIFYFNIIINYFFVKYNSKINCFSSNFKSNSIFHKVTYYIF